MAYDELHAKALRENLILRRLLAIRVAGALLYADDSELTDATAIPCIDFKRDSAEEIERKLIERGRRSIAGVDAAPKAVDGHAHRKEET